RRRHADKRRVDRLFQHSRANPPIPRRRFSRLPLSCGPQAIRKRSRSQVLYVLLYRQLSNGPGAPRSSRIFFQRKGNRASNGRTSNVIVAATFRWPNSRIKVIREGERNKSKTKKRKPKRTRRPHGRKGKKRNRRRFLGGPGFLPRQRPS